MLMSLETRRDIMSMVDIDMGHSGIMWRQSSCLKFTTKQLFKNYAAITHVYVFIKSDIYMIIYNQLDTRYLTLNIETM